MTKKLILCDCLGSQKIDADALSKATGLSCSKVHTALCLDQIDSAAKAISNGGAILACQQERQRFEELAADLEAEVPGFVDLRDRAGWSDEGAQASAKMAALAAEAMIVLPEAKVLDVMSEGTCLIVGAAEVALPAAEQLSGALAVTVLLGDAGEAQRDARYDVVCGQIRSARGALGGFELSIDAFQQVVPGGRGALDLTDRRDGARSGCDIILDLSGGTPLFPAHGKREGYLRADPGSQTAVASAIFDAAQMVGTFEKPLYSCGLSLHFARIPGLASRPARTAWIFVRPARSPRRAITSASIRWSVPGAAPVPQSVLRARLPTTRRRSRQYSGASMCWPAPIERLAAPHRAFWSTMQSSAPK